MTPDTPNPAPASGPRPAKLRILMPIVLAVAALVVFLALFWHDGGGKKGHRRGHSASASGRSPVGGQDELEDLGNDRVTGESPVGGGPSKSGHKRAKGEAWWDPDAKSKSSRGSDGDQWWAPEGKKERAGSESPVGGNDAADESPVGGKPRGADRPAQPSSKNPGEAAGAKGGPDDFWWRK